MESEPHPSSPLLIEVDDPGWEALVPDLEAVCRRAVAGALASAAAARWIERAEISLLLTSDEGMRALNRKHRGVDRATNVLSFPALELALGQAPAEPMIPVLLGDVVLARETVEREANALGIAPVDHLTHLLVHGVLHLLGFGHDDDESAAAMEALERRVLEGLGLSDPYARMAEALP